MNDVWIERTGRFVAPDLTRLPLPSSSRSLMRPSHPSREAVYAGQHNPLAAIEPSSLRETPPRLRRRAEPSAVDEDDDASSSWWTSDGFELSVRVVRDDANDASDDPARVARCEDVVEVRVTLTEDGASNASSAAPARERERARHWVGAYAPPRCVRVHPSPAFNV